VVKELTVTTSFNSNSQKQCHCKRLATII